MNATNPTTTYTPTEAEFRQMIAGAHVTIGPTRFPGDTPTIRVTGTPLRISEVRAVAIVAGLQVEGPRTLVSVDVSGFDQDRPRASVGAGA